MTLEGSEFNIDAGQRKRADRRRLQRLALRVEAQAIGKPESFEVERFAY
jgi:hypothetical protein